MKKLYEEKNYCNIFSWTRRSFSINRRDSIKKRVSDINLKESGKNTYEILKYTRNQKCVATPSDIVIIEKNEHEQLASDSLENKFQNDGELMIGSFKKLV